MVCVQELLEIDWNNEQQRVMVPTKSSTTIVNSLFQVHRAVADLLPRADADYVFEEILGTLNAVVFGRIKSDLKISRELGYKLLCDELDYLVDNVNELFVEKLGFNTSVLQKSVKEIEALKTVFLSS